MLASRAVKPKLSLSISTSSATPQSRRPALSLNLPSPVAMSMPLRSPCTPVEPSPASPTARNTRLNQRGYSTFQQPSFAYANSYSSSKSILKKGSSQHSSSKALSGSRRLQFRDEPTVHAITPIDQEDREHYYGSHGSGSKMSRDERRWGARR